MESQINDLKDELHSKTSELNRLHSEMKQALQDKATLKQVYIYIYTPILSV